MSKQVRTIIIAIVAVVALSGVLAVLLLLPQMTGGQTDTSSAASTASDSSITLHNKLLDEDGQSVDTPVKNAEILLDKKVEAADESSSTAESSAEESQDGEETADERITEELSFILAESGDLVVEKYQELPVNTSKASTLKSDLATIAATKKIETDLSASDFGFDRPQAKVSVTYHDDSTYAFEIGDRAPLDAGYYFREEGSSDIYLVSISFGEAMLQEGKDYVSLSMYTKPSLNEDADSDTVCVQEMGLSGQVRQDHPFKLRQQTNEDPDYVMSSYVMLEPFFMRQIDDNQITTLTTNMTSLTAKSIVSVYPTEEEKAQYGFNDPYSVADLRIAVRQAETTSDSSDTSDSSQSEEETPTVYYNIRNHVVTLGSKDADGNYYAMITSDGEEMPVIYLVSASAVPWAETQYGDILGTLLFLRNITNINDIVVSWGDTSYTFNLEHFPDAEESADKLKVTVDGVVYDTENFRQLYQIMMSVKRNGEVEDEPSGTPDMTIEIHPNDGSGEIVANFYKYNANNYICELNDGDRYLVTAASVSNTMKQVENYLAGKTIVAN